MLKNTFRCDQIKNEIFKEKEMIVGLPRRILFNTTIKENATSTVLRNVSLWEKHFNAAKEKVKNGTRKTKKL